MPERDALQSLRRYTRWTLLATVPMSAFAPLLATVGNGVRWDRVLLLFLGATVLLVVHWRRATQAIAAPAEPLPWRPSAWSYVASVGLMIGAYGTRTPAGAGSRSGRPR